MKDREMGDENAPLVKKAQTLSEGLKLIAWQISIGNVGPAHALLESAKEELEKLTSAVRSEMGSPSKGA